MIKKNYIKCKNVYFYSALDEDNFFEWIKKIKCITTFDAIDNELYLNLIDSELNYDDMKDIIALLYRYKIDMKQLEKLVTEKNKPAVIPWHKKIYSNKSKNA